jgi:peptide/nickel transport system ATP-binding protein
LTSLDPLYTIGRQLIETLRAHLPLSAARARERAIELLRQTGLPAPEVRLGQYPHELSGGMRQRVVIALALAGAPKLVIADEPTTALDVAMQAQIVRLLCDMTQAHGASVLLITHDMGVIAETCDRVAVMYAGRIVEIGPVREIIEHPAHPYTAGLMAAVPSLADTGTRLAQIEGSLPRLGEIPSGCPFHPRCAKASERCRDERPELAIVRRTRAACWWPIVEGPPA